MDAGMILGLMNILTCKTILMVEAINKINADDIFNGLNGINMTNIYQYIQCVLYIPKWNMYIEIDILMNGLNLIWKIDESSFSLQEVKYIFGKYHKYMDISKAKWPHEVVENPGVLAVQ